MSWQPSASLAALRLRARLLAQVRAFFAERGVLEVETPVLAAAPVTDPHLASLTTGLHGPGSPGGRTLFLQTSPEYAMKRLLAAGSGPIYQVSRVFRDDEVGRFHNPEFTLLEWYRPDFDHHALMDEVDDLLRTLLDCELAERLTYAEAFQRYADVDPHRAEVSALRAAAGEWGEGCGLALEDRDGWLALLLSHRVQPRLGRGRPTFLHDFPASQAALARVRPGELPVAERFELFIEGVELANGYHELTDAAEQERRFQADLASRKAMGLPTVPVDHRLVAALAAGMPDCAGVALGFDRLAMIAAGVEHINEVLAFPMDRA